MKKRTKKSISYGIERALLSDVLPYETPLIFSNRHLFKILTKYKVKFQDNTVAWVRCKENSVIKRVISKLMVTGINLLYFL